MEVLNPGLFTSIQDLGRFKFQKYGVPQSGAMDRYAMRICNLLLGNSENCAVMEITMQGPHLKFEEETFICISGADLSATINEISVEMNVVIKIKHGDILKFGRRQSGIRTYLGIKGGFQTELIMDSRSWYDEITEYPRLEKGLFLQYPSESSEIEKTNAVLKIGKEYLENLLIETYPGPEFQQLPEKLQKQLFEKSFTLDGSSNRMAVQFREDFENSLNAIITSPVLPGTVQLTPSGKLIVLMRDCQTTGGYPRVLQLSEKGIQTLAQKIPGAKITFQKKEYEGF